MRKTRIVALIVIIVILAFGIMIFMKPESEDFDHMPPPGNNIPWIFTDPRLNRTVDLSLPIRVAELPNDPHYGGVGTWGFHGGNHPEGIDHTGFAFEEDKPIYSPDYGVVAYIEMRQPDDIKVLIFHNYTIASWFDHFSKIFVNENETVLKGQLIGYSRSYVSFSIVDWGLIDYNNDTGPLFTIYRDYKNGSFVPPFDYLNETAKYEISQYFKNTMLQPFLSGEVVPNMNKAEHNLINPVFLKPTDENDISGVWVYQGYWEPGGYPEILTFIHKNTEYFGEVFHAVYADYKEFTTFNAWEANYTINTSVTPHRIKIIPDYHGPNPPPEGTNPIYGIFEIDTYGNRLRLRIEFSNDTYPTEFTENAAVYLNRTRDHPITEAKFREINMANSQDFKQKYILDLLKNNIILGMDLNNYAESMMANIIFDIKSKVYSHI